MGYYFHFSWKTCPISDCQNGFGGHLFSNVFSLNNLKSENNNPRFKQWFNILLHKQSTVCATANSQCLEFMGDMTL